MDVQEVRVNKSHRGEGEIKNTVEKRTNTSKKRRKNGDF